MSIEGNAVGVACNLKCPYCYEEPQRLAGNITVPFDMAAFKAALTKQNYKFSLFGGEPLLMPIDQLEEVFKFGLEKFKSNGLQTNGTLITEAHLALFKKYRVGVGISMDGPGELNDSRWAGSLEATRLATEASQGALDRLLERRMGPSLIFTIYRGNAGSSELLDRLEDWLVGLSRKGMKHFRPHLLEVDDPRVRAEMSLTDDENIRAMRRLMHLQTRSGVRFDLFSDMAALIMGRDQWQDPNGGEAGGVGCIWNACDVYSTDAVRGVNAAGDDVNCGRTNKDGVDFGKANVHGYERQLALYQTPQDHNGCQGCRFFFACKGQCPGTAVDGDWRNRTEHCRVWFTLLEDIEQQLVHAGQVPLSQAAMLGGVEGALVRAWEQGKNLSIVQAIAVAQGAPLEEMGNREHGDHWDAPDGYAHDDSGVVVHGDMGMTTMHGDSPHGDSYGDE